MLTALQKGPGHVSIFSLKLGPLPFGVAGFEGDDENRSIMSHRVPQVAEHCKSEMQWLAEAPSEAKQKGCVKSPR